MSFNHEAFAGTVFVTERLNGCIYCAFCVKCRDDRKLGFHGFCSCAPSWIRVVERIDKLAITGAIGNFKPI